MANKAKAKRLYLIPVLTKALDILELLQTENQPMVLESIHKRTKISKTTVYRILKTLVHRGYVGQGADRHYRHIARPRKLLFGFGGQSAEMPFSEAVTDSLRCAAAAVQRCNSSTTCSRLLAASLGLVWLRARTSRSFPPWLPSPPPPGRSHAASSGTSTPPRRCARWCTPASSGRRSPSPTRPRRGAASPPRPGTRSGTPGRTRKGSRRWGR